MSTSPDTTFCPRCGHRATEHIADAGCLAGWDVSGRPGSRRLHVTQGCDCPDTPATPKMAEVAELVRHAVVRELLSLAETWKRGPDGDDSLSDGWTSHYVEKLTARARQIACNHPRLFVQHIGPDTWTICPDCHTKIAGDITLLTSPIRTDGT